LQKDTRVLAPNGDVYSKANHHSEEENQAIVAQAARLSKTQPASLADLIKPHAHIEPCMGLRICSHIDDEEVNLMIIKAITSGATTVGKAADSMGVTEASLGNYFRREVQLGRAGWKALKTRYKPQKPGKQTNTKKRKKK
jgi:hypothetical protein